MLIWDCGSRAVAAMFRIDEAVMAARMCVWRISDP